MTFFASYKDLLSADMPRMKRAAAIIMMCLSLSAGVISGNVFPNPFAILFASLSTATLSATLFMYRSPAVFIAPALVFPITAFMTHSTPASLFSIAYVIPAGIIAVSLYRKQSKSAAVFFSSLSFGIILAVIFGISSLMGDEIFPKAADFRADLETFFSTVSMNTRDGRVPLFTSDAARGLSDYVMLSLPAIFVTAVNTLSFLSVTVFAFFCRIFYFGGALPDGKWSYMPEPFSAVIFIVSYVTSSALVPFAEADIIGFAAENMLLILTPAMIIAGEKAVFAFAVKHDGRIFFVFLSIFLIMLSSSLYLMVFSFVGAIYVIAKPMIPFVKRLLGKDGDDEDDF